MGANGTVKKNQTKQKQNQNKQNKNKKKENKSARTKNMFDSKIKQKKNTEALPSIAEQNYSMKWTMKWISDEL